jgi:sodium-dependent dicarboxylate transporter 2/3/5
MAVVGWLLPPLLVAFNVAKAETMETLLPASVVALLASVPLFIVHTDDEQPVLPWTDAMRIDWGVILLFGGGIALGSQMIETGVAHTLSAKFIEVSHVQGLWALTAVCIAFTLLFTEVCSNMASASMLVPLAIAAANELGVPVIPPVLGVGLAASCAFMLPISTGPNAIAYSTGRVSLRAMLRTGLMLELVSGVLIWLGLRALCPVFGWC